MKYLVMETHPAYAVVLDERGRFLRAANLRYQVGQTVEDVVELRPSGPRRRPRAFWAAAAAACLLLAAGGYWGYWRPNFIPYGTLRVQINPDVEFSVSRTDRVLDVRPRNADGEALLAALDDLRGEDSDDAVEELVERALDRGYLAPGGRVTITASSEDDDWELREEAALRAQLEHAFGGAFAVRLASEGQTPEPARQPEPAQSQPSQPARPSPSPASRLRANRRSPSSRPPAGGTAPMTGTPPARTIPTTATTGMTTTIGTTMTTMIGMTMTGTTTGMSGTRPTEKLFKKFLRATPLLTRRLRIL